GDIVLADDPGAGAGAVLLVLASKAQKVDSGSLEFLFLVFTLGLQRLGAALLGTLELAIDDVLNRTELVLLLGEAAVGHRRCLAEGHLVVGGFEGLLQIGEFFGVGG